jgi:hypothetical protein
MEAIRPNKEGDQAIERFPILGKSADPVGGAPVPWRHIGRVAVGYWK